MKVTLSSKLQITKLSDDAQEGGYPFEAIILSGEAVDDWERFVIDLSSINFHKPRLTVNYNHNDELIIGYGENFQVTPEGLKSTGKLVAGTFADEIVKLARQGVPFEASIEFERSNAVITQVGAEASTVVNGRTYQGPISVYSQVPLVAYAICSCGADKYTSLTLLKKEIEATMPKTKLNSKTTNLSTNADKSDSTPKPDEKQSVKSQELADLTEIFGYETGYKLFQDGTDIAEVTQWQALNEKYAQYLSADEDDPKPDSEPAKENDPPKEDIPEPKKDDEKLSATLTKLTAMVEKQSAEIVKLKAAMPRGADPLSHGNETPVDEPKQTSVDRYAAKYKK